MSGNKIETMTGACVVALAKYLMQRLSLSAEGAFVRLMRTELYSLLLDPETRLFLEPNSYLCGCCELELVQGKDALYKYIAVE